MVIDKQLKSLQRSLARYGLFTTSRLVQRLSLKSVDVLSTLLVNVGFQFTLRQRQIAKESLEIAFKKEKIASPTWYWKYSFQEDNQIKLEKKGDAKGIA